MPDAFRFSIWIFEDGPMVSELESRGLPYRILPRSMTRTPWGLWGLLRKLKEESPDVIYLHATRMIALLALILGIPCIERINMSRKPEVGGWCNRLPWMDRIMTEWNTKVIAVSDAIRQQLIARGVLDRKIEVILNFVDFERFNQPKLRTPARQELGIPESAIVVLNVGRMVPQKGQADFIEVASRCLPDIEHLHFLLVGDGPLEEGLTEQAKRAGVDKTGRFHILPFQRDIERIYAASDILLHTAHWEPLANVLLEAMSAGLTVLATDTDGTREAIPESKYGLIFTVGDIQTATCTLQDLISNPEKVSVVGENALNFVQQHFLAAKKIQEFINIFLSVGFDNDTEQIMHSTSPENLFSTYIAVRAKRNSRRDRDWIVRSLAQYRDMPTMGVLLIAAVGRYRIRQASKALLDIIEDEAMESDSMDIAIPAAIRLGIDKKIPESILNSYQSFLGWHGNHRMPDPFRILDSFVNVKATS